MRRSSRLADARILSGVNLSKEIKTRVRMDVALLKRPPCLAAVLVGDRSDSLRYIKHKRIAAEQCGIDFELLALPKSVSQRRLHKVLADINNNDGVDGVMLQLPLPPHLRARPALFHIHPGKDVDGLHPLNAGNLFLRDQQRVMDQLNSPPPAGGAAHPVKGGRHKEERVVLEMEGENSYGVVNVRSHESKFFVPCAALAIRSLLFSYLYQNRAQYVDPPSSSTEGFGPSSRRALNVAIVNKSMVVGVPTAALLLKEAGFIVTLCSRSDSLGEIQKVTRNADVLITAYGEPNVFTADYVKPGAIVIDAGINDVPDPNDAPANATASSEASSKTGKRLFGDIDVESVSKVAAAITPVPGGVGPVTVAHLMQNVLKAYRTRHDNSLYLNSIYSSFLKMYGTQEGVDRYNASARLPPTAVAAAAMAAANADEDQRRAEDAKAKADRAAAIAAAAAQGDDADDAATEEDEEDTDDSSFGVFSEEEGKVRKK